MAIADLRRSYELPTFDVAHEQYFGNVDASRRPTRIRLRGPLLFGIAESERARLFAGLLVRGAWEAAGRLMSIGHDGDRLFSADGSPFVCDVSDSALDQFAAREKPIEQIPGAYGASNRALDALVDTALDAGALGACLTGGGIGGAIIALCDAGATAAVANAVRRRMADPDYAAIAGLKSPLTMEELNDAVQVNESPRGLSELTMETV
jgi:hypothetical protein